jgi:YbbR domain-containing protein
MSGPASFVRRVEAMTVEVRLDAATVDIDRSASPSPIDAQGQPVTFDNRAPVRISPATVKVRVPITQQLSYKTVGLQPELTGTPRSGYVITGVTAEPATVTLVGAPRALAAVNTANTEPIDVSDASTTFTRQVGVGVAEGLSVVQQETVRVTVRISPIVLSQSFTTVPVPDNLGAGVQITSALPSVQVVLQGPASSLQNLLATDLRASLNLAGLPAGTHQINVEVAAPPGVTTQSVSPRIVPVTLVVVTPPTPVPEPTQPPPPTPTPEPTAVRTEATPTATVSEGEAERA